MAVSQQQEPLLLESLNLVSVIASLTEKDFAEFYPQFMPVLKKLLKDLPMETLKQKTIRAKIINCMGYLVQAVQEEKESFTEDVQEFAQTMAGLLAKQLEADDPQQSEIREALAKVSAFLEGDFAPYVQGLLALLLTDAQANIDIKMTNAEEAEDKGVTLKLKGFE